VELVAHDAQLREFLIADLDLGFVVIRIERRFHDQARACRCAGNEVHHCLMADEGTSTPVPGDEAKQAMLDLVPLARARGKVADEELQSGFVGQFLER